MLAGVCHKVGTLESKASISRELNKFLASYQGDECVASLFLRFLSDLVTFGDQLVTDRVRSLYELVMVMGAATAEDKWCTLLALVMDGLRFFICEKCGQPQQPGLKLEGLEWGKPDPFMQFVSGRFKDLRQRLFIVQFLILDNIAVALDPGLTDKLALLETKCKQIGHWQTISKTVVD
jgi:hypothetical protein